LTGANVDDVRHVGASGDDSSTLACVRQRRARPGHGYPVGGRMKPSRAALASSAILGLAVGVWLRRDRRRSARPHGRLEPVRVAGSSMAPTLRQGALLAAGRGGGPLRRGQLVLVRRPGAQDMELVKRIVGLPGEHVRLTGTGLEVDGHPIPEPYLPSAARGPVPFEVRLGPGEYLVLGDRRGASTDGRSFGPIGRQDIIGIVRFVYWPPSAWRTGPVITGRPFRPFRRLSKAIRRPGPDVDIANRSP
jgi:signal peptidase I